MRHRPATLYVYRTAKHELLASTTVDDMVFAGSSNEIIKAFVNAMKRKFHITHDQNPSHILGFDLHYYTKGDMCVIVMDVSQAVEDAVYCAGLEDSPSNVGAGFLIDIWAARGSDPRVLPVRLHLREVHHGVLGRCAPGHPFSQLGPKSVSRLG